MARLIGVTRRLRAIYVTGLDDDGKEVTATRSIGLVVPSNEEEDLEKAFNLGLIVTGLQQYDVKGLSYTESGEITEA